LIFEKTIDVLKDEEYLRLPPLFGSINVIAKLEHLNMSGSIKHKAACSMIEDYEKRGLLHQGSHIVESSSGNLGVALALVCSQKGYLFTCVTDPNVSPTNLALMKAYGAKVIKVEHFLNGGYVTERLRIIDNILESDSKAIWVDQYSNEANLMAHYSLTSASILKSVPEIDYLFVGVGSSGTIMGCSKFFAENKPEVKVIGVEPIGSSLFGREVKKRYVPGIGGNVVPQLLSPELLHDTLSVCEKSTISMCRNLAQNYGWLVGGSTGALVSSIHQYKSKIKPDSTVVIIAADSGINYMDTIYNDGWVYDNFQLSF
jgi:2,3-diaminopropionate biosynthesis protein SbnA